MRNKVTRRELLGSAGAAATWVATGRGQIASAAPAAAQGTGGPGRSESWAPGPTGTVTRNLEPGPTRIRLSGTLNPGRSGRGGTSGQPVDIGGAVKALRDQGLSAAFTNAAYWADASDTMVSELRAALREYDVEVFEIGGYRNMLHTDERARQDNLRFLARALETADRIGCRMVGTITGSRNPEGNEWPDNYAVHPENWTMDTWRLTVSSIKQVLKDTAGLSAVLGMEAQVTTNLDGPIAHRNLMEDVGDPRCKVNLDPTNMIHLHNHFHTTELLNQCFDMLGEDILGCHAKDTYVLPHSQTVHIQEVRPGAGRMDYETYLVRLSRMKWPRALHVEHIPREEYPLAWDFLRRTAASVGVSIDVPPA